MLRYNLWRHSLSTLIFRWNLLEKLVTPSLMPPFGEVWMTLNLLCRSIIHCVRSHNNSAASFANEFANNSFANELINYIFRGFFLFFFSVSFKLVHILRSVSCLLRKSANLRTWISKHTFANVQLFNIYPRPSSKQYLK